MKLRKNPSQTSFFFGLSDLVKKRSPRSVLGRRGNCSFCSLLNHILAFFIYSHTTDLKDASHRWHSWKGTVHSNCATQVPTACDFIVARRAMLDMRCCLVFCCVAAWSVNLSPKHIRSQVKSAFFAQRKAFSAFPSAPFKVRMPPSSAAAASMLIPFAADWLSLTSYVSSSLVFLRVALRYWLAS